VLEGRWRASARGFDLLNELLTDFLPLPEQAPLRPAAGATVGKSGPR
jgi:hypothetical protein